MDRHRCLACTDLVVGDGRALRFGPRFAGPPGLANGGVVVGALTCIARRASPERRPVVAAVTARLHRGVALERELAVSATVRPDGLVDVTLADGEDLLVTAAVQVVDDELQQAGLAATLFGPERLEPLVDGASPSDEQLRFADSTSIRRAAPEEFAHCFVCGQDNPDGLRIDARATSPTTAWAANPQATRFTEADGRLDTVVAIASMDCPSTPSFMGGRVVADDDAVLLGTFEAELVRRPPPSVPGGYRLPSHFWRRDGRRIHADIALVDGTGAVYGLATATWLTVNDLRAVDA